jgi:iron complex outermembrane receptor protein
LLRSASFATLALAVVCVAPPLVAQETQTVPDTPAQAPAPPAQTPAPPAQTPAPPAQTPAPPAPASLGPLPPPADAGNELDLFQLDSQIQKVEIAARREQDQRETAASTAVITAADLEAFGWRDWVEAINSLAGIYVTAPHEYTFIGVRGVSTKGDFNGRLLILVDGHAQNELWAHGGYPDMMGLDAAMIDHIEVLKGPASALYGSLGFLGIINIVTRRGTENDWGRATYEMQNLWGYKGVVTAGHRFKNGLEFGLQMQAFRSLGQSFTFPDLRGGAASPGCLLRADGGSDFPRSCLDTNDHATDAQTSYSLYGHLDYKGFSLKLSYQYWDRNLPTAPYRTIFNDPANTYTLTRGYVDAGYTWGVPEKVQLSANAYFDWHTYEDHLAYTGADNTADERYIFRDYATPYWTGAEARALVQRHFRLFDLSLTGGGTFTYFHGDDQSGPVGMPGVTLCDAAHPNCKSSLFFGAVYAEAELAIVHKLFLTLGGRGDFSDQFGNEFSPRGGIVWRAYQSGTFKLLYAHGFVHPAWYQAYFVDDVSILDNAKLRAERADNVELVFQQQIAHQVSMTASAFYMHGTDIIDTVSVCVPATPLAPETPDCPVGQSSREQRQNVSSFDTFGGELGFTGTFKDGSRVYGNYTYSHAQYADGTHAFNSPDHTFKIGASYAIWRDHMYLGMEAQILSPRRLSLETTDESDTNIVMNAFIIWKGLPKNLTATFKVYDFLAVTNYEPAPSEEISPIVRVPQKGPTAMLRLSYGF